ncbi:MAG: Hsp33 family molecular chaperone HslO [Candidatus Cloacimonetes bacterium]|nr:Hsp33 family molecular chaperone HslO [Candidatus Cloacimonadota bacterium]
MPDFLIRGITKDKFIRFFAVNAFSAVQTAIDLHYLSITNSVILGRLLISGLLMSANLKNPKDLLTLRIDGDGPVGSVLVTATGENTIKGYVQNPQIELPKTEKGFAVSEAIGKGTLSVIMSLADSPPYVSQIELVSGEIGEDLCYYYYQSEQIDTMVNLGVLIDSNARIKQAGGILVQCMPETPIEILESLNKNISKFPNLSDIMDMGHSLDFILEKYIFNNIPIEILEEKQIAYFCNCDRKRFYNGIKLLGQDEIQSMIDSNETIFAECHFCNKKYEFTIDDLKNIGEER